MVYFYGLADKKITPVTSALSNSFAPVFDPGKRYLYFLSDRDFNEVLGNIDFEFANPKTTRVYMVTLTADEPSPFPALSDETEIKTEEPAAGANPGPEAKQENKKNKKPPRRKRRKRKPARRRPRPKRKNRRRSSRSTSTEFRIASSRWQCRRQ